MKTCHSNTIVVFFYIASLILLSTSCEKEEPINREFDPKKSYACIVNINTSEIGGEDLTLVSSRDDDSPLSKNTFSTIVSREGTQLLFVIDENNQPRALTLSIPSSTGVNVLPINVKSTAITLIFTSPGILAIDPQEANENISKIKNLESLSLLEAFLKDRLVESSLAVVIPLSEYDTLIIKCITEYYQKNILSKKSASDLFTGWNSDVKFTPLAKDRMEVKNRGYRYISVIERDIDQNNKELRKDQVIRFMKGGTLLSISKIDEYITFKATAKEFTYTPSANSAYTEFWACGVGFDNLEIEVPSSINSFSTLAEPVAITGLFYFVFPLIDIVAGSVSLSDDQISEFLSFCLTNAKINKATISLLAADSESRCDEAFNFVVTMSKEIIKSPEVIKMLAATLGSGFVEELERYLAYASLIKGAGNLYMTVKNWSYLEPYTKYIEVSYNQAPIFPVPKQPAKDVINVLIPNTFIWEPSTLAETYEIQVSHRQDFTILDFHEAGISGTETQVNNLANGTKYYWRIRATNAYGTSIWSEVWSFTTRYVVPIAAFTANQTTITAGQSVQFTDQSTNSPTSWSWNFGDGGTSTVQNPSHTYATAGLFTVTLVVSNSFGTGQIVKENYITVYEVSTGIVFNPKLTYGSVIDIDGNLYKTIQIGTQTWMAENLKTSKFNDGTAILLETNNATWGSLTTPAYCWYNNDPLTYRATYGALYNWYVGDVASNGNKNVCPTGYHVPTDSDWNTLESYLIANGYTCAGVYESAIAKSLACAYDWYSGTSRSCAIGNRVGYSSIDNLSGFTALPGGSRNDYGQFQNQRYNGFWWTSSLATSSEAFSRMLAYSSAIIYSRNTTKSFGLSVRCVKD